jgi:chloramphenicol O-acetyltransferase type A
MKSKIDIDNWIRKDHFNFFNKFDEPYYGVTVKVDCTIAYQAAKQKGVSFFLYYLYQSLSASQLIDAFKLRIDGNEVYQYD